MSSEGELPRYQVSNQELRQRPQASSYPVYGGQGSAYGDDGYGTFGSPGNTHIELEEKNQTSLWIRAILGCLNLAYSAMMGVLRILPWTRYLTEKDYEGGGTVLESVTWKLQKKYCSYVLVILVGLPALFAFCYGAWFYALPYFLPEREYEATLFFDVLGRQCTSPVAGLLPGASVAKGYPPWPAVRLAEAAISGGCVPLSMRLTAAQQVVVAPDAWINKDEGVARVNISLQLLARDMVAAARASPARCMCAADFGVPLYAAVLGQDAPVFVLEPEIVRESKTTVPLRFPIPDGRSVSSTGRSTAVITYYTEAFRAAEGLFDSFSGAGAKERMMLDGPSAECFYRCQFLTHLKKN